MPVNRAEKWPFVLVKLLDDLIHGSHVVILQAAPQRVGEQFRREAAVKVVAMSGHAGYVSTRARLLKDSPVISLPCGFNRLVPFLVAPHAHRIEIFQAQPDGIKAGVARGAQRRVAVYCQSLAQGRLLVCRAHSAASNGGTFGGGGGGGVPRMLFKTNTPRFTGEVRSGFDVMARTVPSVITPPR